MKSKKNTDFKVGEIVVYPKHGVGEITKIENMEVANIKLASMSKWNNQNWLLEYHLKKKMKLV